MRETPEEEPRYSASDRDEPYHGPVVTRAIARIECRCGQTNLPLEAEVTLNRVVAAEIDIEAKASFLCTVSQRLANVGWRAWYRRECSFLKSRDAAGRSFIRFHLCLEIGADL